MREEWIVYGILALHGSLLFVAALMLHFSRSRVNRMLLLWMALLPCFGPAACFLLLRQQGQPNASHATASGRVQASRMERRPEMLTPPDRLVPLEEALLMNTPRERRMLMHNVMRTNPMAYLDLLFLARDNEDSETVHYATSTIMELQRQLELELQRLREAVAQDPLNPETHKEYVRLLARYCDSGLLTGPPLIRQRMALLDALRTGLMLEEGEELSRLQVEALLAVERYDHARASAERMLTLWPKREGGWIAAMRVAAKAHDPADAKALRSRMRRAQIDWTPSGYALATAWVDEEA